MHILDENTVAISGFASIRERVLLQDRGFFRHAVPDECFDGFGPCVYFANAWFSPGGSTGLHHHQGVDIVSLIPRGQLLHQGTIGAGALVNAGNVQVQYDGGEGFSHNEINPTDAVQPLLQLWFKPSDVSGGARYQVVQPAAAGITCVYGGPAAGVQADVLNWPQGGQLWVPGRVLCYVVSGNGQAGSAGHRIALQRGLLIKADSLQLHSDSALQLLLVRQL